jgi:hypothetical protein
VFRVSGIVRTLGPTEHTKRTPNCQNGTGRLPNWPRGCWTLIRQPNARIGRTWVDSFLQPSIVRLPSPKSWIRATDTLTSVEPPVVVRSKPPRRVPEVPQTRVVFTVARTFAKLPRTSSELGPSALSRLRGAAGAYASAECSNRPNLTAVHRTRCVLDAIVEVLHPTIKDATNSFRCL